ncbi:hypothetical protein BDN72DRAFT_839382 [Pluteus cervinus]|uniref:Uncharacterized protein n=1 Tax=Pluteus cervinus TaxID=181527 RepID=A0ACD3AX48_9AGAR|nr:hypothetical protein BDN72DRAFT_839382 [Pluteus cervinus]
MLLPVSHKLKVSGDNHRTNIHDLPTETLTEIFQHLVVPDCLLYLLPSPDPKSPWCWNLRTKKSILLVCKRWNAVGASFLYRDVAIPEIGALMLLSKTLEDNPNRLGSLVRILTLKCFIPQSYFKLMVRRLNILFSCCSRLQHIRYFYTMRPDPCPEDLPIPNSATQVTLGPWMTFRHGPGRLQQISDRLTVLSLCLVAFADPFEQQVNFPHVKSFTANIEIYAESIGALDSIFKNFTFPLLKNFVICILHCDSEEEPDECAQAFGFFADFCKRHNETIRTLSVLSMTSFVSRHIGIYTRAMVDQCPSLDRLNVVSEGVNELAHPTVTELDLWRGETHTGDVFKTDLPDHTLDFPSLRHLRVFSFDLMKYPLPGYLPCSINTDSNTAGNTNGRASFHHICLCNGKVGSRQALFVHPKEDHNIDLALRKAAQEDNPEHPPDDAASTSDGSWHQPSELASSDSYDSSETADCHLSDLSSYAGEPSSDEDDADSNPVSDSDTSSRPPPVDPDWQPSFEEALVIFDEILWWNDASSEDGDDECSGDELDTDS